MGGYETTDGAVEKKYVVIFIFFLKQNKEGCLSAEPVLGVTEMNRHYY